MPPRGRPPSGLIRARLLPRRSSWRQQQKADDQRGVAREDVRPLRHRPHDGNERDEHRVQDDRPVESHPGSRACGDVAAIVRRPNRDIGGQTRVAEAIAH